MLVVGSLSSIASYPNSIDVARSLNLPRSTVCFVAAIVAVFFPILAFSIQPPIHIVDVDANIDVHVLVAVEVDTAVVAMQASIGIGIGIGGTVEST